MVIRGTGLEHLLDIKEQFGESILILLQHKLQRDQRIILRKYICFFSVEGNLGEIMLIMLQ